MKLKRWALVTVLLYMATLATLTCPVLFASFWSDFKAKNLAEVYAFPGYWIGIGLLGLLQANFLLVPLDIARARPEKRGPWWSLAIVAGLLMAVLMVALSIVILEVIYLGGNDGDWSVWCLLLGIGGWIGWGALFAWHSISHDRHSNVSFAIRRLLAGSVAELLVAVPSRVYVRHKNYCCAGFGTFVGISFGLAIMLFAFGPGVFFLFAARVKSLRGEVQPVQTRQPLLQAHSRDALLWIAASLIFLATPFLGGWIAEEQSEELQLVCALAAVVFAGAALVRGARAFKCREPLWGLPLSVSLMVLEAAILWVWWGLP